MYYATCRIPLTRTWTVPVALQSAQECALYCWVHQGSGAEMRVTDAAGRVVLEVVGHVLRCPLEGGTVAEYHLGKE